MSVDKQKSIEAMRTFARDLERDQKAAGITDEKNDKKGKEPAVKKEEKKDEPKETPKLKAQKGPAIKVVPKKDKEVKPPKPKKKFVPDEKEDKKPEKKEKKEVKDTKPKRIPAFHELQKAVETNIKADEAKKEVPKPKKVKGIEPTKKVGGGTVITDTKKERRPLFKQIAKSFNEWVESVKKAFKPKKKNTYEVSQTNRRKGVVQKATSKTGTIFSADSDTLKEQIKARQRAEKHEEDDEDLSWSPFTEPGYPLLDGEEAESVDPRVMKVAVTKKTHTKPKPVIKTTDKIPELHEKKEEATLEELVEKTGIEIPPEPPKEAPEPKKKEKAPEPAPEPEEVPEPEVTEEESVPQKTLLEALRGFTLKDTNTLAMVLVGIVLAVVIFGIVLFRIFDIDDSAPEVTVEPDRAIYAGASLDVIKIKDRSFNEVLSQTNNVLIEKAGTREYQYARGDGEVLPSDVVMHLIQTNPTDGFANGVTSVRLVETDGDRRALILTTPDETMVRGGMLNWESTLLSDLGIILLAPNVPPNAGEFKDLQFGSLDVRALMFDGNPLLVYSIINETDVIITTNLDTLSPFSQN